MKNISGAEAVIRCLIKENVDVLFGYPGGAIMPVYDELYKFQDKVKKESLTHRFASQLFYPQHMAYL